MLTRFAMRRLAARRASAVVLAMAITSACGTTVQNGGIGGPLSPGFAQGDGTGHVDTAVPSGSSLSATDPSGGAFSAGQRAQAGGPAGSQVSSGADTALAGQAGATTTGSGGTGRGASTSAVPGVSATTIKIGILTSQGLAGFAKTIGFNNDAPVADQQAQWKGVIRYLNAHGGIAGRMVVPVFRDLNPANEVNDPRTEETSHCVGFTQDDHVYAVVSALLLTDAFISCVE